MKTLDKDKLILPGQFATDALEFIQELYVKENKYSCSKRRKSYVIKIEKIFDKNKDLFLLEKEEPLYKKKSLRSRVKRVFFKPLESIKRLCKFIFVSPVKRINAWMLTPKIIIKISN